MEGIMATRQEIQIAQDIIRFVNIMNDLIKEGHPFAMDEKKKEIKECLLR